MLFARWISRWPLGLVHALGAPLGWLVWSLSPTYRRRIRRNARLAGIDAPARRRSIAEAGRMAAELPWLWMRSTDRPLGDLVEWHAPEMLDDLVARRRPLVILTPHMGSFEVAARAYAERYGARQPLTVMYRPARQPWLRAFQEGARARPSMATVPATLPGVRQMVRALKRGETVGLLPDQVPPDHQGVWVPFFGRPAYTMTLASRLIQQTGAEAIVLRCERLVGGRGWRVHIAPLAGRLPLGHGESVQIEAARVINRTLERTILSDPSQYLWGYHRYKHPRLGPAGEATTRMGP